MRTCHSHGSCTACCVTRDVPELEKPPGMRCDHQTPNGCAIYETRPDSCREFACLWLDGWGAAADSPLRLGVVLTFPRSPQGDAMYHAHEAQPGALSRPVTRERLDDLKADVGLLEVTLGQKQSIGGALPAVLRLVKHASRTISPRQRRQR